MLNDAIFYSGATAGTSFSDAGDPGVFANTSTVVFLDPIVKGSGVRMTPFIGNYRIVNDGSKDFFVYPLQQFDSLNPQEGMKLKPGESVDISTDGVRCVITNHWRGL